MPAKPPSPIASRKTPSRAAPRPAAKAPPPPAPKPAAKRPAAKPVVATSARPAAKPVAAKTAATPAPAPAPRKAAVKPATTTRKTPLASVPVAAPAPAAAKRKTASKTAPATPVGAGPVAARKIPGTGRARPLAAVAEGAVAPARTPQAGPVAMPRSARAVARSTEVSLAHRPDQAATLYQIYFRPEQQAQLDAGFIPLDNAPHPDPLREFAVFERLAREEGTRLASQWGALSWRFGEKTGLTAAALRKAIAAQADVDLFYCNPFPENEALYINGWQQGITAHPAFQELCSAVMQAADLPVAELKGLRGSQSFSACNYFIGSPRFWSAYLPWVRGVVDRARARLPASVLNLLNSPMSDPRQRHAGSNYWPFIIERLLPMFLDGPGKSLKVHKLALPAAESKLNTHLQRLREMKDVAHRTHSRWLYACWLNYRNLYLLQTAGSDWCRQYLPQINVTDLEFR